MGEARDDSDHHGEDPVVGLTGARFGGAAGRRSRQAPPTPQRQSAPAHRRARGDEIRPEVGQTGARIGGRHRPQDDGETGDAPGGPGDERGDAPGPEDGPAQDTHPDTATATVPQFPGTGTAAEPVFADDTWQDAWQEEGADPEDSYGLVRPYAWTRGRTAPAHDLAIEALISTSGQTPGVTASPEHRTVVELCTTPRSVAEIAALLGVPLGVARVLLSDMAAAGAVRVHGTAPPHGGPDLALMQRVLHCLHRL